MPCCLGHVTVLPFAQLCASLSRAPVKSHNKVNRMANAGDSSTTLGTRTPPASAPPAPYHQHHRHHSKRSAIKANKRSATEAGRTDCRPSQSASPAADPHTHAEKKKSKFLLKQWAIEKRTKKFSK